MIIREQGWRRFHAHFRRATNYTCWRLGFRQYSFNHIARASQRLAPYAWTRPVLSWAEVGCRARCHLLALFPDSPLPNPPCEFPRHGLSGDYAVSNAAMCSA